VTVDPKRIYPDVRRENNTWSATSSTTAGDPRQGVTPP
jgi:hypothetical protein